MTELSPERHTIVCLSSQNWHDGMWTNKQHIMSRLASQHRVIYVDFSARSLPSLLIEKARKRQLSAGSGWLAEPLVHRADTVQVLAFLGPLVELGLPWSKQRAKTHIDRPLRRLDRYLRRSGVLDPIIWVYHPGYGSASGDLSHKLLVYDCVDEYSQFPGFKAHPSWLVERERALCERADLVFTTSKPLFDKKRRFNPEHTHLVQNVGDAEHFKAALDPATVVPEQIATLPHPVICFIGAVSSYKVETDWLLRLARSRPAWSVVLIGPIGTADPRTDVSQLEREPNVHLFGHKPYRTLPAYLKGADVAIIPYRLNAYTQHVFPIKFFELLASGVPVVTTRLPALQDFYQYVHVADSAEQLVRHCDAALAPDDAARARRVAIAEENSWPRRVSELMRHIERRLEQKRRGQA